MKIKLDDKGGMRRLAADLNKAGERVGAGAARVIRSGTAKVHRDARRNAPVRTGALRDGIDSRVVGTGRNQSVAGIVGATARHSIFVEFGTSDTPAQPFLFPALERHQDDIMRDLAALIDDAL